MDPEASRDGENKTIKSKSTKPKADKGVKKVVSTPTDDKQTLALAITAAAESPKGGDDTSPPPPAAVNSFVVNAVYLRQWADRHWCSGDGRVTLTTGHMFKVCYYVRFFLLHDRTTCLDRDYSFVVVFCF